MKVYGLTASMKAQSEVMNDELQSSRTHAF